MGRMRVALAASAAVALSFAGTAPAHAGASGGGAATGTFSCVDRVESFALDAPAFVFNGAVGALRMTGTTGCAGASVLADGGVGTFALAGPNVACEAIGGGWTWIAGELRLVVGGPCTVAGGTENVMFLLEAIGGAGTFAGAVVVAP